MARQADETGAETQEGRGRGKSEVLFWVLQQISLEKYKYDISLALKNISRNRKIFVEDGKSCKSCLVFYPTSLNNILQRIELFHDRLRIIFAHPLLVVLFLTK